MSQPFHVAEIFTGKPGKFVSLEQSVAGFKGLLEGKYDDLPEVRWLGLVARVRVRVRPEHEAEAEAEPNPNLNPTATAEQAAFYMVGPIEEVVEKAAAMAAELEAEGK